MSQENPRVVEKITVGLIERSAQARIVASQLTGLSYADTVNRALQVYAYLMTVIECGGTVYVKETCDGDVEQVTFT